MSGFFGWPGRFALMCAAAAVGLSLGAAAAAHASRWPSARVTYRDESGIRRGFPGLKDTIGAWNRATTRVRLVPARRGRRAQIRILAKAYPTLPFQAFGSYPPDGRIWMGTPTRGEVGGRDPAHNPNTLLAHEIGHALGLRHSMNPCNLMFSTNPLRGGGFPGVPVCIRRSLPSNSWPCGPQLADARALVRLYGGRVRRRRHFGFCTAPPDPKPEGTLVSPTGEAVIGGYSGKVQLGVRNDSADTWSDGVGLVFVSAAGEPDPYSDCDPRAPEAGPRRPDSDRPELTTPPGRVTTFEMLACRPPAADFGEGPQPYTRTVYVRLVSGALKGPVFRVDLRWVVRPPIAAFDVLTPNPGISPETGTATVDFQDRSSDPDSTNKIAAWLWNFGDPASGEQNTANWSSPSHAYSSPGTYHVTLTVTDDEQQTSSTATDVTVAP